ncbi:MAG: DinB family protein [Acidobacteriaceae bacterium]
MEIRELLLPEFDAEMQRTRTTLERIPEDKPDYKPHEKSMAIGRLAMHVATLPLFVKFILGMPSFDIAKSTEHPDLTFVSREKLLATFDEHSANARKLLAEATNEDLLTPWKFSFGGHVISNESRALTYRTMFLNHLIHHRAQLGVYLRLNNLPVPAIYGPSADDTMGF